MSVCHKFTKTTEKSGKRKFAKNILISFPAPYVFMETVFMFMENWKKIGKMCSGTYFCFVLRKKNQ